MLREMWMMFAVALLAFFLFFYALLPLQLGGLAHYLLFRSVEGPEQESKNFFRIFVLIIPALSVIASTLSRWLLRRTGTLSSIHLAWSTALLAIGTLSLISAELLNWGVLALVTVEATIVIWLVLFLSHAFGTK